MRTIRLPFLVFAALIVAVTPSCTVTSGGRPGKVDPTFSASSSTPTTAPPTTAAPTTNAAAAPRRPLTPRDDVRGVANFARVADGLYRGAQPTAEGFAELKRMGIKTVVNLRWLHSDRDRMAGLGLRYAHIASQAWHPSDEQIAEFLAIVEDPANLPVFVHCQHGADRTGAAIAAYRIARDEWSAADAERELRAFGFHEIWAGIPEYVHSLNPAAIRAKAASMRGITLSVVE